ncbi:MAG: hypothetical protein AAGB35_07675 [Pseudomonadota bacterium]
MGTYLKDNKTGNALHVIEIVNDNWDLDSQLEALESWLHDNSEFHFTGGDWIADIGFIPRPDTSVAGYTISTDLMKNLAVNNITLWLSDYRGV